MKLTKLVSLILVFAILLTLSSCNISDILDTPDDDQGDLGDEGNDNSNNNNGGNEEGADLSKYSPLLQGLLTNPEYDRLIERFENKEEGLAESPLFQPHPYAFLEEQGIDTSKIINGELTANTMSYVIENEPNNLYMYTRVNYPDYHQVYLLRYTLTDQEMSDYMILHYSEYLQAAFINNEIAKTKDHEIIGTSKINPPSLKNLNKTFSNRPDLQNENCEVILLNPNKQEKIFELVVIPSPYSIGGSYYLYDNLHQMTGTNFIQMQNDIYFTPSTYDTIKFLSYKKISTKFYYTQKMDYITYKNFENPIYHQ